MSHVPDRLRIATHTAELFFGVSHAGTSSRDPGTGSDHTSAMDESPSPQSRGYKNQYSPLGGAIAAPASVLNESTLRGRSVSNGDEYRMLAMTLAPS